MKYLVQQSPPELAPLSMHSCKHRASDHPSSLQHNPSASTLPVDEVHDGSGYGLVIVSAWSLIAYGLVPHLYLYLVIPLDSRTFYDGGSYSWDVLQAGLANEKCVQDSALAFVGPLAISWVAIGAVPNSGVLDWLDSRYAAN